MSLPVPAFRGFAGRLERALRSLFRRSEPQPKPEERPVRRGWPADEAPAAAPCVACCCPTLCRRKRLCAFEGGR